MSKNVTTKGSSNGPPTDRHNDPVIDPSKNVRDLVKSTNLRQDDLRKVTWSKHQLDTKYTLQIIKILERQNTLIHKSVRRERESESNRVDAIIAQQVTAAAALAQVGEARATALATQVSVSAETLRNQVAVTAQQSLVSLEAKFNPLDAKINVLSQNMYEQQGGKNQVIESRGDSGLKAIWVGVAVAVFMGMNGLILTAAGIAVTYMIAKNR